MLFSRRFWRAYRTSCRLRCEPWSRCFIARTYQTAALFGRGVERDFYQVAKSVLGAR